MVSWSWNQKLNRGMSEIDRHGPGRDRTGPQCPGPIVRGEQIQGRMWRHAVYTCSKIFCSRMVFFKVAKQIIRINIFKTCTYACSVWSPLCMIFNIFNALCIVMSWLNKRDIEYKDTSTECDILKDCLLRTVVLYDFIAIRTRSYTWEQLKWYIHWLLG